MLIIKNLVCQRFDGKAIGTYTIDETFFAFLLSAYRDLRENDDDTEVTEDADWLYNFGSVFEDDGPKKIASDLHRKGYFVGMTEVGTFGICREGKEVDLKAEMGRLEMGEEVEGW